MEKKLSVLGLAVLMLLILVCAFIGLGELPIRIWDESRLAVNALEMYENGFSLITTFEYKTDLWNTKPPLLVWIQWGLMQFLGPTEEAIRIPSALAVVLTTLSLIYFSKRITRKYTIGIFGSLILITSYGYISYHGGRSGDYDALLTMFMTTASLLFFVANQNKFTNPKENIGVFVLLALGVMTKSIAALLFAPAYLILLLLSGTLITFLTKKSTYVGLVIFILIVGGFYISREFAESGYLEAVWVNDLFGRYTTPLENHRGPFTFYLENFVEKDFKKFFLFSILGLVLALFRKKDDTRTFLLYCAIIFVIYILIISNAETKLPWYLIPALPFAAILGGGFFGSLVDLVSKANVSNQYKLPYQVATLAVVLYFFYQPYYQMVTLNYKEKDYGGSTDFYAVSKYLKDTYKDHSFPPGYAVLYSEYAAHKYFYVRLHQLAGSEVEWKYIKDIETGDKAIIEGNHQLNHLRETAEFEILWEEGGGRVKGVQILEIEK